VYVTIRIGDRLPTVALAQARLTTLGLGIGVDGHFGAETQRSVMALQEANGVDPTGVVSAPEWRLLFREPPLVSVDHIDAGDVFTAREDLPHVADGASHVYVTHGLSDGLRAVIGRLNANHAAGSVSLLRFHGHGSPGHMGVTAGEHAAGSTTFLGEAYQQQIAAFTRLYAGLGRIMRPDGSVELHGCNVGAGSRGDALLAGLSDACGVPVSAGYRSQSGGRRANRFEGPVRTICPGRVSLGTWAASTLARC